MDKYLEAEKELAELKGWKDLTIAVPGFASDPCLCITTPTGRLIEAAIPQWTRDDQAAFRLMVEHAIWDIMRFGVNQDELLLDISTSRITTKVIPILIHEHPDLATAIRYAVVLAVIAKLKAATTTSERV